MRAIAAIILLLSLVAAPLAWAHAAAARSEMMPCPHQSAAHGTMGQPAGHAEHSPENKAAAAVCCIVSCAAMAALPSIVLPVQSAVATTDGVVDRIATAVAVEPADPPPRA